MTNEAGPARDRCGSGADPWLDDLLRAARSDPLEDAGFSASVLARIDARPAMLAPAVALAAALRTEDAERRHARWTMLGVLVGTAVAVGAVLGAAPSAALGTNPLAAPGLALFLATACLAGLALFGNWDAPAR